MSFYGFNFFNRENTSLKRRGKMSLPKSKKIVLAILTLCFCSFFIIPTSLDAQSKTIVVGLVGPMSGRGADYGRMQKMGAVLATEQINAKGGVRGYKFDFVVGDDKMDPKEAANVAKKFVANKKIKVVTGSVNSPTVFAAGPIYDRSKLPYLVCWASHPKIPEIGKYVFQSDLTQDQEAPSAARYALNNLRVKKVAHIHINDAWGNSVRDRFPKAVEKLGGEMVAVEAYTPGEIEFRSLLIKILDKKPDALYLAFLAPAAGQIVRQAKDLGVTFPIYMSSAAQTMDYINLGGPATEGTISMSGFSEGDPDPVVQSFVKSFKARFNNETPTGFSAYVYDAFTLIAEAVKNTQGEVTRDSIRDGLANLKNARVLVGSISPNKHGFFGPRKVVAVVVKNKAFVYGGEIK
jgi:branched-chain amino acid transport system substrate-binding protein